MTSTQHRSATRELESQLRRGALQLAILESLDVERYGYELLGQLRARGLAVSESTLYPALRRLERAGLLTSRVDRVLGRPRRYYRLTERGREARESLVQAWRGLVDAVGPIVGDSAQASPASDEIAARERELLARLDEIERLRSEFLYAVAHELRTPLTLVRTATGLLLAGGQDEATQQRLLRDIGRSVDQLHTLVTDLLDLARLRGGALDIQLGYLDFGSQVRDVVARMQPLARSKAQQLTVSAPEPGPRVLGDRRRLEQVLLNLLSNAHKFTPAGGRIEVRVEDLKRHVRLVVADTGPGIPPEDLPHLFERFWIGRGAGAQGGGGSGLGLPIVKGLVEAHGGQVSVESRVGVGTTFSVLLPVEGPREDTRR